MVVVVTVVDVVSDAVVVVDNNDVDIFVVVHGDGLWVVVFEFLDGRITNFNTKNNETAIIVRTIK